MGAGLLRLLAASLLGVVLTGCGREMPGPEAAPSPAAPAQERSAKLTQRDVEMYLAVHGRALERVEAAMDAVEPGRPGALAGILDIAGAERDASRALGLDWERYRWVREEVARLLSLQRQREDTHVLSLELSRARDDLKSQLGVAGDAAGRQFLEAQIAALEQQLAELEEDRKLAPIEREELTIIESVRAEIATQVGRQERIQRRLRELLEQNRALATVSAAPRVDRTPVR